MGLVIIRKNASPSTNCPVLFARRSVYWNNPCNLRAAKEVGCRVLFTPTVNAAALTQTTPLIRVDLCTADFASSWQQCNRLANYLAHIASSDRPNTFLHANLLSTALTSFSRSSLPSTGPVESSPMN